ncbi:uncharacterized protein LOC129748775 isoform X2 [Uranotaenia lowii]|uniref:uncharacterized protein LOC129748775 isoform X2 n=1 Tax=Uranotaenia lowii TaxID=190385 RepID=UPI0024785FB5|nr:uncharacterized protein LOC129748775 isoform X2 [Uranotaenia lowii]
MRLIVIVECNIGRISETVNTFNKFGLFGIKVRLVNDRNQLRICFCFCEMGTENKDDGLKNYNDESNYLKQLLNDGQSIPVDSDVDSYDLQLPPWYNDVQFKRAQRYFKQNYFAMFVAMLCGLLSVLAIPSILSVLIYTKQSSTPLSAYRRYVATIMHILNWYFEDLTPGSSSWRSIAYVRRTHVATSKRSGSKLAGRIISQKDMAVTQFGFVGYIVLAHRGLGIVYDKQDMEAIVHFWRVIGYMIGIEDRYNLCTDSLAGSQERMRQVQEHILRPALAERSSDFEQMGRALIDGMWCFNPFLQYEAFVFLTCRITGVPGYHYWNEECASAGGLEAKFASYSRYARSLLYLLLMTLEVWLSATLFRWYLNSQMIMSRFLITYFPFLAFYKFGIRDSYVRILK